MSSCELKIYLSKQVNKLINHLIVTKCPMYISHILSYHYPLNKPIHCDKPNCNDKNEAQ